MTSPSCFPSSNPEGLPNIMLEAMTCGAISDAIIDGKTRFIMGNNPPE